MARWEVCLHDCTTGHWSEVLFDSVYKGGVVRGIRHGYGEFYCSACPSVYSGPWHHGKRLGKVALYLYLSVTK